jgi:DNA-binding NarL/FixJ family response regulator
MNPIRLVVVDDHALFRAGLVGLLREMGDFDIVGEAANGREAVEIIRIQKPDVVLLDVNMPVMDGIDTVRSIKSLKENDLSQIKILMLTISKHEEDLFDAIKAGADGYLLKNVEPDELRKAILQVVEGQGVLSAEVTQPVMRALAHMNTSTLEKNLSKREVEILECLAQGMTATKISQSLYISENTVKTHIRHIYEKLNASNRAEAVRKAGQLGLVRLK